MDTTLPPQRLKRDGRAQWLVTVKADIIYLQYGTREPQSMTIGQAKHMIDALEAAQKFINNEGFTPRYISPGL